MTDHDVSHHNELGFMWSDCSCGWSSRLRDANDSYQITQSKQDGIIHERVMIARQWRKDREASQRQWREQREAREMK